jgi:hypothetical protein
MANWFLRMRCRSSTPAGVIAAQSKFLNPSMVSRAVVN